MEAGTSTATVVSPGRQHFHPGMAKAWARFDGTATSITAAASYNVSSITDNGLGNYTVIYSTAFSNGNYGVLITSDRTRNLPNSVSSVSAQIIIQDSGTTAIDASVVTFVAFGDQ